MPSEKKSGGPPDVENIIKATSDWVEVLSINGRIEWTNDRGLELMDLDRFAELQDSNWLDFWKGDLLRSEAEMALVGAREGRSVRFQGFCPTRLGTPKWWDVMLSPILGPDATVANVLAISRDVTTQRANEAVLRSHNQILEAIVSGMPLQQILIELVKHVESQAGGLAVAAILLLDPDGKRLRHGAAPSLPDFYNRAIDGIQIDANTGTCCAAAFLREVVITPDIASAPGWRKLRELPLALGLRAAWSMPIIGTDGVVLGTFGTYFRECREPTTSERQVVDFFCKTAALAIERDRLQKRQNASAQAIRESEQFLQSVLGASADCIKIVDQDGRIQWMSDNGKRSMEVCDFSAIENSYWPAFWQGETRLQAEAALEAARAGRVGRFRGFCPTCAGTPKWWDVAVTAIRSDPVAPMRLLGISRDISEQVATQERLREKDIFTHAIFHQAATLIGVVALDGTLLDVNNAALAVSMLRRPDEIGHLFWETSWWRGAPEVQEQIRAAVLAAAQGESSHFASKYFAHEGEERWADIFITPMKDGENVIKILAEGRDITELVNARKLLEIARDAAETASQAKDDFLAALSHELRTPLTPILLLAGEAGSNATLPEAIRSDFRLIAQNAELEARLIDDLLDLTRITRGKMALSVSSIDIRSVLRDAIANVRADLAAKRISLDIGCQASDSTVIGDPVRLQQVFWNILRNAAKFTHEGGMIQIAMRTVPERKIEVTVTDNGMGMMADEVGHIFNAFVQGHHASGSGSHRFGGLGLGLAISRMLVELHSGRIWASSPGPGLGSSFTVQLPLASEEPDPPPLRAIANDDDSIGHLKSRDKKILLVEDHELTRVTLMQLLRRRHCDVTAVGSMAEAVASAAGRRFDLLLTDIGLPDGDGYALMGKLRLDSQILGIALTGYGMEADVQRSVAARFCAHLTKPVQVQALDKALATAFADSEASA